jgi:hypothetical protein
MVKVPGEAGNMAPTPLATVAYLEQAIKDIHVAILYLV